MQAFPVTSNQLEWLAATQALCLTHTHPKWFPPVSLTGSLALQPHCRVYIYSSNLVLTNRKRQLKCVDKMKPTCLMRSCCSSNKQLKPTDSTGSLVASGTETPRRMDCSCSAHGSLIGLGSGEFGVRLNMSKSLFSSSSRCWALCVVWRTSILEEGRFRRWGAMLPQTVCWLYSNLYMEWLLI